MLLLAFDFWTVKNVSGRLLVGLRWWNEVKADGTTEWIFESHEGRKKVHRTEMLAFWGGLVGFILIWVLFLVATLFEFEPGWFLLVLVALVMNGSNLYGYVRCAKDQRSQLQKHLKGEVEGRAGDYIRSQMMSSAKDRFFGLFSSKNEGGSE